MNKLLIPSSRAAASSNIPVVFSSTNANKDNYKYVINICYESKRINDMTTYIIGMNIYTKVKCSSHNFVLGEQVFIYQGNYIGYYNVVKIIDTNYFVIDLQLSKPFVITTTNVCKYYRYKLPNGPDGVCKMDLSNTLSKYVKSVIKDNNLIQDASSTHFEYFIVLGEEYSYELRFTDNQFYGAGELSFINPSITTMNGVPLKVGDKINVQQDLVNWNYTDNEFNSGNLSFISNNTHSFKVGQIVNIIGQITEPYYNGPVSIISVPNNTSIIVDKAFISSTPVEPGSAIGEPTPEYNTSYTITQIFIDGVNGLRIVTDGVYTSLTIPIPGTITYLYSTITNTFVTDIIIPVNDKNFIAYDARIDRKEYIDLPYTIDFYKNNYILNDGPGASFSSILDNKKYFNLNNKLQKSNRIDYFTKSFLLIHSLYSSTKYKVKYSFYDKENGTLIGYSTLSSVDKLDIYVPIGIKQLINNSNRIDSVGFNLATTFDTINYYEVSIYNTGLDVLWTKPIKYYIANCMSIKDYTLMWKDSKGSYISYPFKFVTTESTDVTSNTYYQREGNFNKIDSNTYDFTLDNLSRGESTINTTSINKYKLTSDWVYDYENTLFEDLIKSTDIYLQLPCINSYSNELIPNKLIPVILETKTIQYGSGLNHQIYNYSPTVRVAYNDYR